MMAAAYSTPTPRRMINMTDHRCPICGAIKYDDEPCSGEGTLSHAPRIPTLTRPVIAGRYITVDWDELRDLADEADKASGGGDYAAGVHDVLRWLADGGPTPSLLQLLGGR